MHLDTIVKLIVFIIVIFIALFRFGNKLFGGEFLPAIIRQNDRNSINPTASQIIYELLSDEDKQSINEICKHPSPNSQIVLNKLMDQTEEFIKSLGGYKWRGNYYKYKITADKAFRNFEQSHLISDANIDLLNLLATREMKQAIAVCEWHGDAFESESSEFFTVFDKKNGLSIISARESRAILRQFRYNFGSFYEMERDRLIAEGLAHFFEHDWKVLEPIGTEEEEESSYIIRNMNMIIRQEMDENDDDNDGENYDKYFRKTCEELKKYAKTFNPCFTNKSVFIDFIYKKAGVNMAYKPIHQRTTEILKWIIDNSSNFDIAIVRLCVTNDGVVDAFTPPVISIIESEDQKIRIATRDRVHEENVLGEGIRDNFKRVRVPKTSMTSPFSYDEGLLLADPNNLRYDIQIEHSEDVGRHKSNIIEFLMRSLLRRNFKNKVSIKNYIHNTLNYDLEDGHIAWSYLDDAWPIEDKRLYISCGDLANDIYFMNFQ